MVIERLPGRDLGQVYKKLTPSEKKELAECIASIQDSVSLLPTPEKFGFAFSLEQANLTGKRSWLDIVMSNISRSESRIIKAGKFTLDYVVQVQKKVVEHEYYLRHVKPTPFLDDMTTKNVIIDGHYLSGIVDTDQVCFGDPLFTIALTKMALLSQYLEIDYIEYWLDAINASQEQRNIVILVSFMVEK